MRQINLLPWRNTRRKKGYFKIACYFLLPLFLIVSLNLALYVHEETIAKIYFKKRSQFALELSEMKVKRLQYLELKKLKTSQENLSNLLIYMGSLLPEGLSIQKWCYQPPVMEWDIKAYNDASIGLLIKSLSAISFLNSVQIKHIQNHHFVVQAHYVDSSN